MTSSSDQRPSSEVLAAFEIDAAREREIQPLAPGVWRVGPAVLKRSHSPVAWLEWEEAFCRNVVDDGFRLQRLRRARDGEIEVDGWIARDHLEGDHRSDAWDETLDIGRMLLLALARATPIRPPTPAPRVDAWATADRMAWGELAIPAAALADDAIAELMSGRRPVAAPSQVVHGDLTGNVLFHRRLPPAIIDFSPYVRPVSYALGVVVADAVIWHSAGLDIAGGVLQLPGGRQGLLRAMLFRHLTALLLPGRLPAGPAAERYAGLRRFALTGL